MICCLKDCETESGDNVICMYHVKIFRSLPYRDKRHVWDIYHRIICGNPSEGDYVQCYHCKKPKPWDMICADHIKTKGSSPELKFNINNAQPACAICNSNSNLRTF